MNRENKIKIVVADDRPVVLYGLQSWFESHERFSVSLCVRSTDQLLARLKIARYDLIVLSGGMEGAQADDFALLRALRDAYPQTPIVAFTDSTDAHVLADMQRAGAAGLVSMREEARAFERVCERVISGATEIVSPRIAACCDAAAAPAWFDASPDYDLVRMSVRQFLARI
ncbi:two-component system, response regulator [Caballeronia fortuita]|uniref:Two-component system, response regulator n=1 Tax=Caballeronia fortuita TaxID=1777138 RepID=A0A158A263_9BURK|nr:response regulator [Caballeronia fortuita]SAK51911.1 two-component system, response regulator [Caballeronia fortuita]